MNKLTQEETARIFAMYYGANVCIQGCDEIQAIVALNACQIYTDDEDEIGFDDCRLVLTPLSAITDEHAKEVCKLGNINYNDDVETDAFYDLAGFQTVIEEILENNGNSWSCFQYLICKGYAVPLFFGLNHWANSKTAIELGIAIYYTHTQ